MAKNTSDDTSQSGNPGGFESMAQKAESNIFSSSNPRKRKFFFLMNVRKKSGYVYSRVRYERLCSVNVEQIVFHHQFSAMCMCYITPA